LDQALDEIDQLTIIGLRELETNIIKCLPSKNYIVNPMESLLVGSKILVDYKLHRLPMIDITPTSETIVSVLTESKILSFVAAHVLLKNSW
jgi:5'-AMP-activated protein kinase regulatory gamma subunit